MTIELWAYAALIWETIHFTWKLCKMFDDIATGDFWEEKN